jgi:hypothetical protein
VSKDKEGGREGKRNTKGTWVGEGDRRRAYTKGLKNWVTALIQSVDWTTNNSLRFFLYLHSSECKFTRK